MNDTFQVSITRVQLAPTGAGISRRLKPGHRALDVLKKKESVITIKNNDNLCCARAIVTAKARLDNHPKWDNIRRGFGKQKELALRLHRQAGVRAGVCGYEELCKFQECLKDDYRLIVVYADRGFDRRAFAPLGKPEIILLHQQDHYDVITSLPGFFGTSYVCAHCLKPYDHVGEHACNIKESMCGACRQLNCADFAKALPLGVKPSRRCHLCRRAFFRRSLLRSTFNHGSPTQEES